MCVGDSYYILVKYSITKFHCCSHDVCQLHIAISHCNLKYSTLTMPDRLGVRNPCW